MTTYYKLHTLKCLPPTTLPKYIFSQVGIAVPNSIHLADNIIRKILYYP